MWLLFGPVLEIFGLLFIPTSGNTDCFFVKYVYSFKTVYDVQIILQSGRHKTCLIAFLGVKHFI